MSNGLTKEEAGSGYDPVHPFANRDPRMAMTVLYPGMDWVNYKGEETIINTLDKEVNGKTNPDHPGTANNSSKTGLTWLNIWLRCLNMEMFGLRMRRRSFSGMQKYY